MRLFEGGAGSGNYFNPLGDFNGADWGSFRLQGWGLAKLS